MAEQPEKRFQRIMDKLYEFPKRKLQPLGTSSSQKRKAGESSSRGGGIESAATTSKVGVASREAPLQTCRPWDRGDLMRRLATFKARTWFGKPKVVGPVNCARRGWVNVDMDTIGCEACGSRLLFSTPSSWTFEQVEKAAAVFSLKLDNGHKLLCPWIDNVCDESLASFPPTPAPALIEAYRERCQAVLQLSALPIISQSALDYMKCQQLDNLLDQSSNLACTVDNGVKLIGSSSNNGDVAPDAKASNLYFEAQKIIALCGWEPRLLPYTVGCETSSIQNGTRGSSNHCVQSSGEKNDTVGIYAEKNLVKAGGEKERDLCSSIHCDPASAVLDCKLCGACVGLWVFDSTARPLECFTLVDSPEASTVGQESKHAEFPNMDSLSSAGLQSNRSLIANQGNVNLKLSIAGGASPTRQHIYRPRISLPVISRHLRAQLQLNHEFGNSTSSGISIENKFGSMDSQNTDLSVENDKMKGLELVHSPETTNSLRRKRNEETSTTGVDDCDIPSKVNKDVGLSESFSGNNEIGEVPSNRRCENNQEAACVSGTNCMDKSKFSGDVTDSDYAGNEIDHEAENGGMVCKGTQIREDPIQSSDAMTIPGNESHEDDIVTQFLDFSGPDDAITGGSISPSKHDPTDIASCSEVNTTNVDKIVVPEKNSVCKKSLDANASNKNASQSKETAQDNELAAPSQKAGESDGKLGPAERNTTKAFAPIQHHRPFCPWVATTEGQGPPGWKMTLFALDKQGRSPSSDKEATTKSLNESEDPIISIRKLFQTPPSKRPKHN